MQTVTDPRCLRHHIIGHLENETSVHSRDVFTGCVVPDRTGPKELITERSNEIRDTLPRIHCFFESGRVCIIPAVQQSAFTNLLLSPVIIHNCLVHQSVCHIFHRSVPFTTSQFINTSFTSQIPVPFTTWSIS